MRHVTVTVTAPDLTPDAAYRRICDFGRYPELTDTVRNVVVHPPRADGSTVSEWTVSFRDGLMRWTERDVFHEQELTLSFEQLSGDFETFEGSWRCEVAGGGTLVTFEAAFDLGMPTLAAILDPVAESTLRSNVEWILRGLLGAVTAELAGAAHD
ncbi:type II toxin-antitoxin system RatA family toxin [Streptomyces purpureus]|uniref:type II toxin-antitoxin system RatA family toxin n=1 Tax=Streptomyces purpureus TaxID=1951 RepID=UPI000375204F|nr:SRPBCC family protein [Streptomyces purpureus]